MERGIRLRGWLRRLPWDIILVYLVFNALVGVLGGLSLRRIGSEMKNRSLEDLTHVVVLKGHNLGDWLQGLLREASDFSQELADNELAANLITDPRDTAARLAFLDFVGDVNPVHRFAAVVLVDSSGAARVSIPEVLPVATETLGSQVRTLMDVSWPQVSDLFLGPRDRVYLAVTAPLAGLGALVLLVDAERELFPPLREWPTDSRSAETLLVRKEGDRVVFLNALRFNQAAALSLTASAADPRSPAAAAMRERSGVMEGVDYRGERVLAAWRSVPGSAWSIVAKVDAAEVEKPVRDLARVALLLILALVGASTLFLVLRLRQLARRAHTEHEALVSHYGYLAQYANDIILLLDDKGTIVEANDRALEAYGYGRAELLALRYGQLAGTESRSPLGLDPGTGLVVESLHRRRDGSQFPAEASIRSVQAGPARYVQCIIRDVSERRKAEEEKRRLEEQIAGLRKQEAIGQLAGGVAHDLNNALAAIMGYAEYLGMKLPAGSGERRCSEGILAAAGRASSVTHGLLAFSQQQGLAWNPLDLRALLLDGREALQRSLGEQVRLELELDPGPLSIRGDADLLRLALVHLADNARKAMPAGGRFTVAAAPAASPSTGEAGFVCLRVRDTGLGMSEAILARLFEPFFTTQGFGKGAGLGLSMVFGIVRQHGGRIEVASEPGQGTEFRIFLPLVPEAAERGEQP